MLLGQNRLEFPVTWEISNVATSSVVTKAEVKSHLNIASADTHFDTYIDNLIKTAVETLELELGRPIRQQTYTFRFSGREEKLVIEITPVQSITSVSVLTETGTDETITASEYEVIGVGMLNWRKSVSITIKPDEDGWLEKVRDSEEYNHLPLKVVAVMGWTSSALPESIKRIALTTISDMFNARGEQIPMILSRLKGMAGSLPEKYRESYAGTKLG